MIAKHGSACNFKLSVAVRFGYGTLCALYGFIATGTAWVNKMQVYLVGGAVRDELLELDVKDKDYVVVGATPEEMLALGYTQVGKDFPVFLHPTSKNEYALARTERKVGAGYTGFSCYAAPDVSLEDDLLRRDLTINAIAKDDDGSYIDPHGGLADINNRVLRHVSPAFSEDPLRVLRLARFAARFAALGFTIAEETWQLAQQMVASGELSSLNGERVWQELSRALQGPSPKVFAQVLDDLAAWPQLLQSTTPVTGHWSLLNDDLLSMPAPDHLPSRYALLCLGLFANQATPIADIHRRLRVPSACAEVSDLAVRVLNLLSDQPSSRHVDNYLALLKSADPIRRPQRWQQAIEALEHSAQVVHGGTTDVNHKARALVTPSHAQLEQLNAICAAYCAVDTSEFIAKGLQGAAVGEALLTARRAAIKALLQSP